MRKTELKNHLDRAEIRKKMQDSETREQFQRWQAIYLVAKGLRVEQVSEYIGITKGTIYQWVFKYNHGGPQSFQLRGRGGRRFGLMCFEEEADFLEHLRAEAERGEIAGAFRLHERLEKKLGHKVSKDYLYDLLHRHDWRKVAPRPNYPDADVKKQEEFKKKLPELVATAAIMTERIQFPPSASFYDVVCHLQHVVSRFDDLEICFISAPAKDHIHQFINHVSVGGFQIALENRSHAFRPARQSFGQVA